MTALYAVPAWLLLGLAIAVAAGGAVAGHVAVRRAFPAVDFHAYNDVAGIVLGVVGGLFGVTLAFIIAIVWQEFDGTRHRVSVEAAAADNLWHTAQGLPAPLGPRVRRDVVGYATLMVDDEWPAMRNGGTSPRAESLLTRTFEDVARFRPRDAGAANAQSAALAYLGALHDARHQRLADNDSGVSAFEWAILLIGAGAIVTLCYLVGSAGFRAQLLMTGVVAGMIAAMFVLIFELDYPFRGDLSIGPSGWQEFMVKNRSAV
ncbi:MAG TPA: DUF4239 domain-containing protein [Candidatus Elarobacter sp.]|jgi:hypothetical protein|nr:DUF4239 domain-containing protein [Candidatus Elarobacter sp.]